MHVYEKNNTNCKKIHKLSSVFPGIILHKSLGPVEPESLNMIYKPKNGQKMQQFEQFSTKICISLSIKPMQPCLVLHHIIHK